MSDLKEPKAIAYDYLFNYFGGDTFKDCVITGASITVALHVYKNGQELKFTEEPKSINNIYFNDIIRICFDPNQMFTIHKNLYVDNLFRIVYEFDKIDYKIVGFSLDKLVGKAKDEMDDCPKEFEDLPVSEPMSVTKEEFMNFISSHLEDFDIPDNKEAQCPSVQFI